MSRRITIFQFCSKKTAVVELRIAVMSATGLVHRIHKNNLHVQLTCALFHNAKNTGTVLAETFTLISCGLFLRWSLRDLWTETCMLPVFRATLLIWICHRSCVGVKSRKTTSSTSRLWNAQSPNCWGRLSNVWMSLSTWHDIGSSHREALATKLMEWAGSLGWVAYQDELKAIASKGEISGMHWMLEFECKLWSSSHSQWVCWLWCNWSMKLRLHAHRLSSVIPRYKLKNDWISIRWIRFLRDCADLKNSRSCFVCCSLTRAWRITFARWIGIWSSWSRWRSSTSSCAKARWSTPPPVGPVMSAFSLRWSQVSWIDWFRWGNLRIWVIRWSDFSHTKVPIRALWIFVWRALERSGTISRRLSMLLGPVASCWGDW